MMAPCLLFCILPVNFHSMRVLELGVAYNHLSLSFVISAEGLIEVFGYEGRGVNVSCHYDQGYENSKKYFCMNDCGSSDILITTKQKNKGKYSITDDKNNRIVTVTISDLQSHDAGKYWCGVTRWGKDTYSEVKLYIKEELFCLKSYNISGIEGRPVTLQCPNSGQQHDNKKFLCKGDQHNNCTDMMGTKQVQAAQCLLHLFLCDHH
uniref:Immunoglobulin domain-containing protein n=1 Tax=Xiphophorus maculatus TaxID=8083 RepID=A0A3B5QFZ9_XIPMA